MGLELFLWTMKGYGGDCICRLDAAAKPNTSKPNLEKRAQKKKHEGVIVAWHPSVHVEIHGYRPIGLGQGAHAVYDIRIATCTAVRYINRYEVEVEVETEFINY
jgi:hypothetical protein